MAWLDGAMITGYRYCHGIVLEFCFQPATVDNCKVRSGTNIFHDVGIFFAGYIQRGVVWLAHSQKVWCLISCGQLYDICNESCGAQSKHMDT